MSCISGYEASKKGIDKSDENNIIYDFQNEEKHQAIEEKKKIHSEIEEKKKIRID